MDCPKHMIWPFFRQSKAEGMVEKLLTKLSEKQDVQKIHSLAALWYIIICILHLNLSS